MVSRVRLTDRGTLIVEIDDQLVEVPFDSEWPVAKAQRKTKPDKHLNPIRPATEPEQPKPGAPKLPPRVMYLAGSMRAQRNRLLWGPFENQETKDLVPFCLELRSLKGLSQVALARKLKNLRTECSNAGAVNTSILNLFMTDVDLKVGVDLRRIRALTSAPQTSLEGFRLFLVRSQDAEDA